VSLTVVFRETALRNLARIRTMAAAIGSGSLSASRRVVYGIPGQHVVVTWPPSMVTVAAGVTSSSTRTLATLGISPA
jgi:hypothetical protein